MAFTIMFRVEGIAGSNISQIMLDMINAANRLDMMVACNINAIDAHARPGDTFDAVWKNYKRLMDALAPEKAA